MDQISGKILGGLLGLASTIGMLTTYLAHRLVAPIFAATVLADVIPAVIGIALGTAGGVWAIWSFGRSRLIEALNNEILGLAQRLADHERALNEYRKMALLEHGKFRAAESRADERDDPARPQ